MKKYTSPKKNCGPFHFEENFASFLREIIESGNESTKTPHEIDRVEIKSTFSVESEKLVKLINDLRNMADAIEETLESEIL